MDRQCIEGHTDLPDFTKRASFRELLLMGRLAVRVLSDLFSAETTKTTRLSKAYLP